MQWKNLESKYHNLLKKLNSLSSYELLEIEHGASLKEVKLAYRKKMNIYHPDKAGEFMKKYNEEISKIFNRALEQIKMEITK